LVYKKEELFFLKENLYLQILDNIHMLQEKMQLMQLDNLDLKDLMLEEPMVIQRK
jgi:hypothetical protein